ncbi:MAG: hypothetical protein NTU91_16300, partial [Chloroflexi bacterium]|nr:hypothetical protein [Chloroflexota bacterium]
MRPDSSTMNASPSVTASNRSTTGRNRGLLAMSVQPASAPPVGAPFVDASGTRNASRAPELPGSAATT